YRSRSTSRCATAACSAAICCCSKLSAEVSRGGRRSSASRRNRSCKCERRPVSENVTLRIMGSMQKQRFVSLIAPILAFVGLPAGAAEYVLPKEHDMIGEVQRITARHEDTFVKIGRRYGVGYEELKLANPTVDAWLPGEGTEVVVPTRFVLPRAPREGIVVNIAELRLYYFPKDQPEKVHTYPISIGRMDWGTPLGTTTVVAKNENPSWYPPASIRKEHADRGDFLPAVVPPGPANPLGKHALRLGLPGYLIHGTN